MGALGCSYRGECSARRTLTPGTPILICASRESKQIISSHWFFVQPAKFMKTLPYNIAAPSPKLYLLIWWTSENVARWRFKIPPHVQLDLIGLMVISSLVPAALLKTPAMHWYNYSAVHECWPAVLCLRHRTISPSDYPAPNMRRRRCVLRWSLNLCSDSRPKAMVIFSGKKCCTWLKSYSG